MDDPEATKLILETLFDMKWRIRDIHAVVIEGDDNGEAQEEEDA